MVSGVSTLAQNQFIRARILELQNQMNVLNEQVSSGKKATVFSGISEVSSLSLQLNNIKKSTNEFIDNIAKAKTRVQPIQATLQRINDIAAEMRNDALVATSDALDATKGNGSLKALAQQRLNEIVSLLNIKVDTDYLFAGRASGSAPMTPYGDINQAGTILGQVAGLNGSYPLGQTITAAQQRYAAIRDYLASSITHQAPGGTAPAPYGFTGETGAPGGSSYRLSVSGTPAIGATTFTAASGFDLPAVGQYVEFGTTPPHNASYLVTGVNPSTRVITFSRFPTTQTGLDFAVAAGTSVNVISPAAVQSIAAAGAADTDATAALLTVGSTTVQVATIGDYTVGDRIEFATAAGTYYDVTAVDAATNTITFRRHPSGGGSLIGGAAPIGINIAQGYAPGTTTLTLASTTGVTAGMSVKFSNSSATYNVVNVSGTQITVTAESTTSGNGLDAYLPPPITTLRGGEVTATFGAQIEPLKVRIDNGIDLEYGIRGDNPAIRKVLDAIFALATTDLNTTTSGSFREIARLAADDLNTGRSMVSDLSASLGVKENVLDTTEQRHRDFLVVTESQLDRVENVDMADAVSRLTQTQTNLEASYKLLTSVRGLSLANYI